MYIKLNTRKYFIPLKIMLVVREVLNCEFSGPRYLKGCRPL